MRLLFILAAITALVLLYALCGRGWLKAKPWADPFFAWVEPAEILLFKKSETILFARLKIVIGALLTLLTQIGSIDLTPIMPFVPEKYQPTVNFAINLLPLLLSGVGFLDEKLRNATTRPIELVEAPAASITPEVAVAIAAADATKQVAVAAVQDAKAA